MIMRVSVYLFRANDLYALEYESHTANDKTACFDFVERERVKSKDNIIAIQWHPVGLLAAR